MKSPYEFKHIAPTYANEKQPAIFLLHGMGSNEDDLFQLTTAVDGACHIFSLRGPIKATPGYAFYLEQEGEPVRNVFDQVLMHTQNFIYEAIQEYDLDLERIYVLGFNQGAVLAQSLALTMGNKLAGVIALSGYLPKFVEEEYVKFNVDRLKMFMSHGTYDYVVPFEWAQNAKERFEDYGADVTFKAYEDGHGVTPQNIEDLSAFLKAQLLN